MQKQEGWALGWMGILRFSYMAVMLNRTVERLNRTVEGFKWASKPFNRPVEALNRTVERPNRTVKGFKWASKPFNRPVEALNRTVEGFEWVFDKK